MVSNATDPGTQEMQAKGHVYEVMCSQESVANVLGAREGTVGLLSPVSSTFTCRIQLILINIPLTASGA